MALVSREQLDSRPLVDENGKLTATRRYAVHDDTSPITSPDSVYFLLGTGSPDVLPTYGDVFPGLPTVKAIRPSIRRMDGQTDLWEVTWQYREVEFGAGSKQPEEEGFVDYSCQPGMEFYDFYQALTASEFAALVAVGGNYAYGTPAASPGALVAGPKKIDIGGTPVSRPIKQIRFSVTETVTIRPSPGYLIQFVGRRNNAIFAGCAQGSVLCESPGIRRIDVGLWQVTYNFLADAYYHMRQTCDMNPDGTPILTTYSDGAHAANVRFVQPFPDFADLWALSPNLAGAF